jgi:hypothetical protein
MTNEYDAIKTAKARTVSVAARGDDGKVIRAGKNLSGNRPFTVKLYAMVDEPTQLAVLAAPLQVQLMVKHMIKDRTPRTGKQIIEDMIAANELRTKIDPPVLFAYYRRLLEKLGVQHVG